MLVRDTGNLDRKGVSCGEMRLLGGFAFVIQGFEGKKGVSRGKMRR